MAVAKPFVPEPKTSPQEKVRALLTFHEAGVLLALILFVSIASAASETFRSPFNLTTITRQTAVVAIVAMGQTLVIISGAFDLSQGAVAGLSAMMTAWAWQKWGFTPVPAIIFGLFVGMACGFMNGVLAARFRLHPIVMTLATATIISGLNYLITEGSPIAGLPEGLIYLGFNDIGPFPVSVLVMLLVAVTMHLMLTRTLFGLRVLMIGGNLKGATDIGIQIDLIRIAVYTISGLLAGLGGIVTLGRVGSAIVTIGADLVFLTVTAAILGGTLLSGGKGSMLGTMMGAAIMAVVRNALVVFHIGIYAQNIVQGLLVVVALIIDQFRRGELTLRLLLGKRH